MCIDENQLLRNEKALESETVQERERMRERVSLLRVCIRCREESEDLYD